MNKYQEALNILHGLSKGFIRFCHYFDLEKSTQQLNDKKILLQELVDKATPKKIITSSIGCYCPICESRVGDNNQWTQALVKYCLKCGQALDCGLNK